MRIKKIMYEAKDGAIFWDPIECQEYEKRIGIIPGSVADVIRSLEEIPDDPYCSGRVVVQTEGGGIVGYCFSTRCIDHKLRSYVNPENLDIEQRYDTNTISDVVRCLSENDKDAPVSVSLCYSNDIAMSGEIPQWYMNNPRVWVKMEGE